MGGLQVVAFITQINSMIMTKSKYNMYNIRVHMVY